MTDETPYFVEIRGCINCPASKSHREKHGTDYGFDHELIVRCLLMECYTNGYSLSSPFFDPAELIRLAKKTGPHTYARARDYCEKIDRRFGIHYSRMGHPISEMLKDLKSAE